MTAAHPSFTHRLARRLSRPSLYAWLTLALIPIGMLLGQRLSESSGMAQLAAVASERLELYGASLESELARHGYLPSLIAIDEDMQALLQAPQDEALRQRVSLKLARINVRAGATASFIVNGDAQVLAVSQTSPSLAGKAVTPNELKRVGEALGDDADHFFATNESNGSTDFLMVQSVRRQGRLLGAIVVKVNLAPLEATWVDLGLRSQGEKLLVVDENDVVIMSSVPGWKHRILGAADAARQAALRASARYPGASLQPMNVLFSLRDVSDTALVKVPPAEDAPPAGALLAQQRPAVSLGVQLVTLSDPSEVWRQARYAAWGGGAFAAALGMLGLHLASRRRALRTVFRAQADLQRAHEQLELLVNERTRELRVTNEELKRQIEQRLQAESGLVQAGKLAVLGQMSAGISHEISQPLTALRALSGNTLRLLENGRQQAVADNLRAIDDVVERMSLITRQLKSFARKADAAVAPVTLARAISNVLVLLQHRIRTEQIQVHNEVPDTVQVQCDGNRLEQVLVNLVGNALDAMEGAPRRVLSLTCERSGERVLVRVGDTGPGMEDALLPRLFEPFFTTKPAGQGLGLGLVISSNIIHEFGGALRGHSHAGGMTFEFDLGAVLMTKEQQHV